MRYAVFFLVSLSLAGCGRGPDIANLDSQGTAVICFGDSITEGVGASEGNDYPSLLAAQLGQDVINAGASGDTTQDALRRIYADVLERDPRLVIVEFGGNDFLQRLPKEETFRNLDRIVELIQDEGAMVVLAEVSIGLVTDEYASGYKRIARKRRALLVPDIMGPVMNHPSMKDDGIHPNDAGYKVIAESIYKKIRPLIER